MTSLDSPRPGMRGFWDRLVGPDATPREERLVVGYAVVFSIFLLLYVRAASLNWSPLQLIVVLFIAVDIAGGIVANTTDSGSRWWHRPSQTSWSHLTFVVGHLHPFVLALLFPAFTATDAAVTYGFLVSGAIVVLLVPEELQRPVAMTVYSVGLLVALYLVTVPAGLEWFVPFLYLKLLPGHLVSGQ